MEITSSGKYEGGSFLLAQDLSSIRAGSAKAYPRGAGMGRQYCGRLGKVANCQAGMFLAYVSPLGWALVDKRLYLPESWTSDPGRCAATGVPKERGSYRSKTELALEMLERARELGHLRAKWVAGDGDIPKAPSFREGLAAQGMWYVLDVPGGTTV